MLDRAERKKIEQWAADKQLISVVQDGLEDMALTLVPIAASKNLLLGHYVLEFNPDGYKVLDTETITDLKQEEIEDMYTRMMRAEGILDGLVHPGEIDLTDWQSLFTHLQAQNQVLDIELEYLEGEVSFFVGRVSGVATDRLEMRAVDHLGKWEAEPVEIRYNEIAVVSFGNRYSTMYGKYSEPMA